MGNGFPWFRLYANDTLGDRKIKRIHKTTGLSLAEIRGAWLTLMCLASESPDRGVLLFDGGIPYDYEDLVDECGMDSLKFHTLFMHFTKMGMVAFIEEDGIYYLPAWGQRQPASDSTSAERSKRYREKKKSSATNSSRDSHGIEQEQEQESEEDKDIEKETTTTTMAVVFSHYENNIGSLTGHMSEVIQLAYEEYPHGWIVDAIDIAVESNVRKWRYVDGILKNWKTNGKDNGRAKKPAEAGAVGVRT